MRRAPATVQPTGPKGAQSPPEVRTIADLIAAIAGALDAADLLVEPESVNHRGLSVLLPDGRVRIELKYRDGQIPLQDADPDLRGTLERNGYAVVADDGRSLSVRTPSGERTRLDRGHDGTVRAFAEDDDATPSDQYPVWLSGGAALAVYRGE